MTRNRAALANPETEVRIGTILPLPSILRSLGTDPVEVLSGAGFDVAQFDDPDIRISFVARNRLIAHCVAMTGCQHLGLLIGQQGGLHSLGLVGLLVKYSPDVGTALRNLAHFLRLNVHGAAVNLDTDGGLAILRYDIYQPGTDATAHIGDGAVAIMFNILHALCGPAWKATEIRFGHGKPEDVRPYRRFFRDPLVFDAEQNAVVFAADWLAHPLPEVDPALRRLLQKEVEAIDAGEGDDFPGQVRGALRTAIPRGWARSDRIAALFSIHSRTLNRRLKVHGTSFQALLDEARFEIARQMLEDSRMEVDQIAMALDYADASAFTRAFRRWSGTTPGQWRENHRAGRQRKNRR